jgi:hypothetical protein
LSKSDPRSTLLKHIADSLEGEVSGFASLSLLERSDGEVDPFDQAVAKALVGGAQIDLGRVFGVDPGAAIELPVYPAAGVESKSSGIQSEIVDDRFEASEQDPVLNSWGGYPTPGIFAG